jgi:hypothetical protein
VTVHLISGIDFTSREKICVYFIPDAGVYAFSTIAGKTTQIFTKQTF